MKENRLIKRMILSLCVAISITSAANALYYGSQTNNFEKQESNLAIEINQFEQNYINSEKCKNFYITEKQKLLSKLSNEEITGTQYDTLLESLKSNLIALAITQPENKQEKQAYKKMIDERDEILTKKNQSSTKSLLLILSSGISALIPLTEHFSKYNDKTDEEILEDLLNGEFTNNH